MKVAIFGATGLIGSHITQELNKRGIETLVFSRKKEARYFWNPDKEQLDLDHLENVDVVLNFVGESIQGIWTKAKKRKIRNSRLQSTEFLAKCLLALKNPPKLYIGASAVGYYGEKREGIVKESDQAGRGFLAELVKDWEAKTDILKTKMRVVLVRLGVVLAKEGGFLRTNQTLFIWFLAMQFGSGKQMISWISIDDVSLAIMHIINTPSLSGAINLVSPFAITQEEFLRCLSKLLARPCLFHLSERWTRRIFGEFSTLFLTDLNVSSEKLTHSDFVFANPTLEETLKKYLLINESFC